ncbi:hypothetical protein DTO027I6_7533 [Penicillium roqueforti]|uniref:uncharacterized protein n=1 Tax=Penicillium roqueforti TaxID=5082 RepID=UPI00190DA695|nr:uncharacterized protein LCP9604111_7744 [Penicillium roqueforti]KAF9243361.1 hypothetical protein LCP9604111_7744 [Penicillium roqueforti]KAI2685797.1 hypothetical protein CBS147355_1284 [Penicillium roqueforti]KAI2691989.1 hypothetical protein LCP963914a_83 [Penicillium roqueforti]KAI2704984.1 hypothetical protein CBS147372_1287 [Penicillium roqueforti]KAI2718086.1 hypothetical protein CBS147318_4663 [Penicillium roqueforti]
MLQITAFFAAFAVSSLPTAYDTPSRSTPNIKANLPSANSTSRHLFIHTQQCLPTLARTSESPARYTPHCIFSVSPGTSISSANSKKPASPLQLPA